MGNVHDKGIQFGDRRKICRAQCLHPERMRGLLGEILLYRRLQRSNLLVNNDIKTPNHIACEMERKRLECNCTKSGGPRP